MKIEMGFVLGSRGRIFITVIIGGLIGFRLLRLLLECFSVVRRGSVMVCLAIWMI